MHYKEAPDRNLAVSFFAKPAAHICDEPGELVDAMVQIEAGSRICCRTGTRMICQLHQHCEVGEGLSTLQNDFIALYREFSLERISHEELARRMGKKGFKLKGLRIMTRRDSLTTPRSNPSIRFSRTVVQACLA